MEWRPVQSLGLEDPLEEEMAIHYSILAWRIPETGEPGGLPSMGLHRVGGKVTQLVELRLWDGLTPKPGWTSPL